jgi:hypothetical protein
MKEADKAIRWLPSIARVKVINRFCIIYSAVFLNSNPRDFHCESISSLEKNPVCLAISLPFSSKNICVGIALILYCSAMEGFS